jgi:hypothetical protein
MKATLTFDLDDQDDDMAHKRCVKALDMAMVIFEFQYNSRKDIENLIINSKISAWDAVDAVFKRFYDLLDENVINIDSLIV